MEVIYSAILLEKLLQHCQGSGESGKRERSELHVGRRLGCLETEEMDDSGVFERWGCNDGMKT